MLHRRPAGERAPSSSGCLPPCEPRSTPPPDARSLSLALDAAIAPRLQAQHRQLFDPPLPPWKAEALSAIRIGVADKLFVEFEIEPARARDAAVWLSTHSTLATSPPQQQQQPAGSSALPGTPPPPQRSDTPTNLGIPPRSPPLAASSATSSDGRAPPPPLPPEAAAALLAAAGTTPEQQQQLLALLPPDVLAALPPRATGGVPEPFNLGRRPEALLGPNYTPEVHAAALGAAAAGHLAPPPPGAHAPAPPDAAGAAGDHPMLQALTEDSAISGVTTHRPPHAATPPPPGLADVPPSPADAPRTSSHGRPARRRKHRRTIHSYAFLWPVQDAELLGAKGHPALLPAPPDPRKHFICLDMLRPPPPLGEPGAFAALPASAAHACLPPGLAHAPAWIQGLHSIRYCPGPEWIEPSLLQGEVVPVGGGGGGVREPSPAGSAGNGSALSGSGGAAGAAAGAGSRSGSKRTAQAMAGLRSPGVNPLDGGATHVSRA